MVKYRETVSPEFVTRLCDNYYNQASEGNQPEARAFGIAVERAESDWAKQEVLTELNIRLVMEGMRRKFPESVKVTEGY
jgi:hypothetical protein